jgi:hypothetical protein
VAAIIFNMKKISGSFNLVLLAFAICVVGCKEPEVAPPPLVEHHTKIDGKLYDGYVISQGGNENCESIFVATHSLATESIPGAGEYWSGKLAWEVEFKLSQYGHPISVRYLEKNPNYGHGLVFLPPNFNPMSTFRISDFHYDSTTGEISFSYEGTVFYTSDNTETREIQGSEYTVKRTVGSDMLLDNFQLFFGAPMVELGSNWSGGIGKPFQFTMTDYQLVKIPVRGVEFSFVPVKVNE